MAQALVGHSLAARQVQGAQQPQGLWPVELAAVVLLHCLLGIGTSERLRRLLSLRTLVLALRETTGSDGGSERIHEPAQGAGLP